MPDSYYDDLRIDFLKKYTEGALDVLIKHRQELRLNNNNRQ